VLRDVHEDGQHGDEHDQPGSQAHVFELFLRARKGREKSATQALPPAKYKVRGRSSGRRSRQARGAAKRDTVKTALPPLGSALVSQ
jgi:hypothetical protein